MEQPERVGDITQEWLNEVVNRDYPTVKIKDMSMDASVGDLGFFG